jgi:hypothetical protein
MPMLDLQTAKAEWQTKASAYSRPRRKNKKQGRGGFSVHLVEVDAGVFFRCISDKA